MFDLFVGDTGEYLADIAHNYDPGACLLTGTDIPPGTYYTSIADMGSLQNFQHICLGAKEIWYCPPARWTTEDQRHWTEHVIAYVSQWVRCNGAVPNQHQWLLDQIDVKSRASSAQQLWTVGCSITAGVGVAHEDKWPVLIQGLLDLPMTDLSRAGSSVIWQSDQITGSPIKQDDIVLWGVTSPQRLSIINNRSIYHLTAGSFEMHPHLLDDFSPDILDNDTLIYHTVLAVRRASVFCEKINAKLVALGLMHDFDNVWRCYNIPEFKQLISWPGQYRDMGTDNMHPGPLQHREFALEFIKCLK